MSRREGRESETRRCKIDREPSPKRWRRDGKPKTERNTSRNYDVDQKLRRPRLQDALPLEAPIEAEPKAEYESVKKGDATKDSSSNPTLVPRAQSYFQHDERTGSGSIAGQGSRRRSTTDSSSSSRWSDTKERSNETRKREERSQGNNNSVWHHDRFDELEARPVSRKRPAFRETKTEQTDSTSRRRPFERAAPETETQERRGGGTEKWKHDLFDEIASKETSSSKTTTTTEEQIAKLEALLA